MIYDTDLNHLETQYDEVKTELSKSSGGDIIVDAANVSGTLSGDVTFGADNLHILKQRSTILKIDTRTVVLTYDANGRLTKVEEMDGSTVVKTTNLTYDESGRLSQVHESAGGVTITSTLSYGPDGKLASVSRAVG